MQMGAGGASLPLQSHRWLWPAGTSSSICSIPGSGRDTLVRCSGPHIGSFCIAPRRTLQPLWATCAGAGFLHSTELFYNCQKEPPVSAHCLLSWLCPLCTFIQVFIDTHEIPLSLLFSRINQPSHLSAFPCRRSAPAPSSPSQPLVSLSPVAPCQSLLSWGAQNWTQLSSCGPTRAEQRGGTTSLSCWRHQAEGSPGRCWPSQQGHAVDSYSPQGSPAPPGLSCQAASSRVPHCVLGPGLVPPQGRALPSPCLSCRRFVSAHGSILPRALWMEA